jgi:hypothetical protein
MYLPVQLDNDVHSHCVLAAGIIYQQKLAFMYDVFGRWILSSKLLSCFYRNNSISNVAEHYP